MVYPKHINFNGRVSMLKHVEEIDMKNKFYVLVLLLISICCSNCKQLDPYSLRIQYQYIVFKINEDQSYNVYVENFFNIKNNTNKTLVIPYKNIENSLRLQYKNNDLKSFSFMSESDLKIAPLDSIDLNCAVDVKDVVKEIPSKINKNDFRMYDNSSKKYLPYSEDYEIIRTTEFGVFKEQYLK